MYFLEAPLPQTSALIQIYTQPIDRQYQLPAQHFTTALEQITQSLESLCYSPAQVTNHDFTGSYYYLLRAEGVHLQVVVIENWLTFYTTSVERDIRELKRGRCLLFILTDLFGGVSTSVRQWFSRLEQMPTNGRVFTLLGLSPQELTTTLEKLAPLLPR